MALADHLPPSSGSERHVVVRHYGQVELNQPWDDFVISSAAYMATAPSRDVLGWPNNDGLAYWYSMAVEGGIEFC